MNPQETQARLNELLEQVKNHCMCLKLEIQPDAYLVFYPAGMIFDGARASTGEGKAVALTRLLDAMERHWIASGIH